MMRDAVRMLLLAFTLAFSVLFILYSSDEVWGYPFSEQKHNAEAWIYFLSESLIRLVLAYVIWELEPVYRKTATCFLLLMVADTVDYILTCNEKWHPALPKWATLNVFSIAIFGYVFVSEVIKNRKWNHNK